MTSAQPRRRGRPRAYNPEVALRDARDVFWRNGYAATSLDDLATGMGMNRPSIYAAFGDKRALYLRAVAEYAGVGQKTLTDALAAPSPLRNGLYDLFRGARDFYLADDARGCFLLGTAVTEANRDPEVAAIIEATFAAFTAAFTARFERAAHQGELADHPPAVLAQIATAALNNLAVRTRSGASSEVLDALIDAAVEVICTDTSGHQE
ncbi:TetR/AcrR family transcriptional regulator [Mycobacterium sp. 21AC1]|uniref:TetR/AcrR family transcriptional regulator n=1 Tax=[Mycobacterium] appelbergii TaxID=2939269 RepID=UPI00293917AA|nr:TetR/AcrR family transcriptional regulator [Mycobacterium sp. 21AC1]MDV3128023.1 TetR/AcrR family transcriptional regulator [Mycobacterium sp. 21AC1]